MNAPNSRENQNLARSGRDGFSDPLAHLQEQFAKTRLPLEDALELPGEVYCSPVIAALEKERIFLKTWLCVAHEHELPNPGDYAVHNVSGESFILARDEAGKLGAFINKCLHRGVPVAQGSGNCRDFSCPYHAWLYDLQGNLQVAPQMHRTNVNLKGLKLRPLQVALWRGWIFVNFSETPQPFSSFIEVYEKEFWWFRTDECRLADVKTLNVPCNWKLLVENLIDIYHVPVIHKGSFGSFSKDVPRDQVSCNLHPEGAWTFEIKTRPLSKGGRQLFPMLPWLEGKRDETVNIKAGIFPNINISLRVDSLRIWSMWPTSPNTTEARLYTLFTPSAFDMPNFQEQHETSQRFLMDAVANEDGPMVTLLQESVQSPFYQPGPFSFLEDGVHHIMRYYLDKLSPAEKGTERR